MSKSILSRRISTLSPSATLAVDAKVKELTGKGATILNLSLGEPDFTTPKNIQDAAIDAMHEGFTHYTQTAGIPSLRVAIAKKFKKDNGITYDPSEIVVGVGSKQLLYHSFLALFENGDEVLVPTPTWSTYVEQLKLAGARAVVVPLKKPFKLRAADLKSYITKKTKGLILNSPANPTGAIIDGEELEKIATLAVKNNLWIISDEIYEKILYHPFRHPELVSGSSESKKMLNQVQHDNKKINKYVSIASLGKEIKSRTITVNGFSKAYAMTGWRIGYAGGPREVINAMINLQSQTTSNTSSIAQMAGIEALQGDQKSIQVMAKSFAGRRAFLLKKLLGNEKIQIIAPEGAFYLFFSVQKCFNDKIRTSADWCTELLEKEQVALVPGEAFLYPGWVRMSYAASMEILEASVTRIKRFIG